MVRKAAFFDLDGTLAVGDQPPAREVADAIRAFRSKGNLVCLCTGRATSHLYKSVLDIGFDGIVAGGGAFVSVGKKILYQRFLSPEWIHRIIAYFMKTGQTCILEGERNLYAVNPRHEWDSVWPNITDPDAFSPNSGTFAGQGIFKFTAYGPIADPVRKLVEPEMTVIDHEVFVEVVPNGCSKADGMRRVIEEAGIPRENSIAFGDSRNDIDMLKYAGLGIAMGGSPEPVQMAADRVTSSFHENGVAMALNTLI